MNNASVCVQTDMDGFKDLFKGKVLTCVFSRDGVLEFTDGFKYEIISLTDYGSFLVYNNLGITQVVDLDNDDFKFNLGGS